MRKSACLFIIGLALHGSLGWGSELGSCNDKDDCDQDAGTTQAPGEAGAALTAESPEERFKELNQKEQADLVESMAKSDQTTQTLVEQILNQEATANPRAAAAGELDRLEKTEKDPNKTDLERSLARAKKDRLEEAIALKHAEHELQKVANNPRSSDQARAAAQARLAANRDAMAKFRGGAAGASPSTATPILPVSGKPAPIPAPTALAQVEGRKVLTGPDANAKSFPISRETRADGKQVEYSPVFNSKGEVVPGIATVKVSGENMAKVDALPAGYRIDGNGIITKGNGTEPSALKANGAIGLGNGNYALTYQRGNSGSMYADSSGTVKNIGADGLVTPVGSPSNRNGVVTVSTGEGGSNSGSALGLRAQGTQSSLVTLEKVATTDDYARARLANRKASAPATGGEVARTNDSTAGTPMPGTRQITRPVAPEKVTASQDPVSAAIGAAETMVIAPAGRAASAVIGTAEANVIAPAGRTTNAVMGTFDRYIVSPFAGGVNKAGSGVQWFMENTFGRLTPKKTTPVKK